MSSIMRRRRGLISAIGCSCLWIGLRQPQACQTGDLPHDGHPTSRASGLVQSPFSDSSQCGYPLVTVLAFIYLMAVWAILRGTTTFSQVSLALSIAGRRFIIEAPSTDRAH